MILYHRKEKEHMNYYERIQRSIDYFEENLKMPLKLERVGGMDSGGYLFITGRIKEIINRGGEKISPWEVEEVLKSHPAVRQAVTFSMPHKKLGETVASAVVLKDKASVTEMKLREFTARRLVFFKVPVKIIILDKIPVGSTGKIQCRGIAEKLCITSDIEKTDSIKPVQENIMKTIGYYITGKGRTTFDTNEFRSLIHDIRNPIHIIYQSDKRLMGLATGGEISSTKGIPLIASLPPMYPEWLGDRSFLETHKVRFAFTGGAMARGISSAAMVIELARCGMMGFFGSGGMKIEEVEKEIKYISEILNKEGLSWGANLIHTPHNPLLEETLMDMYLKYGVRRISASAFTGLTPSLVRFASSGLYRDSKGFIRRKNYIFAKISHPEVAKHFVSPPPEQILKSLVLSGKITREEAEMSGRITLCEDLDIEGDSGGHTDNRPLNALFPAIVSFCNKISDKYHCKIRYGAAGGIGTPQSVASAFALGASHIVVGSVYQSAVEAGTSSQVKELLSRSGISDVMMTISADRFETGSRVQVLKKGTMMGLRGNLLYKVYKHHDCIEDIPEKILKDIEKNIFRMTLQEVWEKTKDYFATEGQIISDNIKAKNKMALIFKWYLGNSAHWAVSGRADRLIDYQIWCSSAMGAFNEWVKGSFLEDPEKRLLKQIALNLMEGGAILTRGHQLRTYGVPLRNDVFLYRPEVLDID